MGRSRRDDLYWGMSQSWRSFEVTWLAKTVGAVLRWRDRVRQRHALGLLDDARLRDIGLTRDQVERERRKWF